MFKKRVSIRDDDDEIFRGGQTSTKKKSIFWGQPPLRLFFRHLINPSLVRVLLLRTRTKTNAILMVNEAENESESNNKKRFSVVARKQPLLHSFLMRKSNLLLKQMKTIEKRFENVHNCICTKNTYNKYYPGRASVGIQDVIGRIQSNRLRE